LAHLPRDDTLDATTEVGAMRVLLGYDGSPAADHACELVASIDWPAGTGVDVVTAYSPYVSAAGWPGSAVDGATATAMFEADRVLAEDRARAAADRFRRPSVVATWSAPVGRPANEILARATPSTDLIVVGSRGHGSFAEALLGSVSAELVDHAPCPVLIARARTIGRVILAEDGSPGAEAAAAILGWPIFANSKVRVVTIAEKGDHGGAAGLTSDAVAEARKGLTEHGLAASTALANRTAERLRGAGLEVDVDVRHGDPAREIVLAAAEWKADLIVMGTRGRTGLERLLVGSVARKVLHHAPCSVLIDRLPTA
jgi:nucleotide-binding universal stress UspA family protein